jgi:hypothetical protein
MAEAQENPLAHGHPRIYPLVEVMPQTLSWPRTKATLLRLARCRDDASSITVSLQCSTIQSADFPMNCWRAVPEVEVRPTVVERIGMLITRA